ncbi:MAG: LPS assembly lipoprotein LptE [Gemmatimonadota bacterium]
MSSRSRLRSGLWLASGLLWLALAGCNYSLRAGSGLPDHVRTVAVLPFDNTTTRSELTDEVHQRLLRELPRALGVRSAGADVADAIVQGTIISYAVNAPLFRPGAGGAGAEVLQRQVTLAARVEIIDVRNNVVLWEDQSLRAEGTYLDASETEEIGRTAAIQLLVQRIVDGAQSNW